MYNTPRTRKPKQPELDDDAIRDSTLRYAYDRHKKARSAKGTQVKIGEFKAALKTLQVKQHRIVTNLIYLVQAGWIEEIKRDFIVQTGTKPVKVESITYRITNRGIDRIEGPSRYQTANRLQGINVTNIQGVTVIGEGNIVNAEFEMLSRHLDLLGAEIRASDKLGDREKLTYQAEIDTIKSQLMKPRPEPGIVAKAWESFKAVATLSGVASAIDRVRPYIETLLH